MKMTKRYALKLALRDLTSPVDGELPDAELLPITDHDRKVAARMIAELWAAGDYRVAP